MSRARRLFTSHLDAFRSQHPDGTVVQIRRFREGMSSDEAVYGLDEVLLEGWVAEVSRFGGPYCFVSSGVISRLSGSRARQLLMDIATHFPGAWLIMDTSSTLATDGSSGFCCENPALLESWGLVLQRSETAWDGSMNALATLPWYVRSLAWLAPDLMRSVRSVRDCIEGHRINRFRLTTPYA